MHRKCGTYMSHEWYDAVPAPKFPALSLLTLLLVVCMPILASTAYAASPDLTVDNVWLETPANPGQAVASVASGEQFNIVASLKNMGDAPASGYYLDVYYDSDYGRGGPDNITAGEVQEWYVGPLTATAGTHVTQWVLDPDNQIAETNESNNQLTLSFTIGSVTTTTTMTSTMTTQSTATTTSIGSVAMVYPVVRGANNGIYYATSLGGAWILLPGATADSPTACACGGSLHMAVRGGDGGIYYGYVSLSTGGFSGWTRISGSTLSAPALAADSSCNLYLVVRGSTNGIYLNTLPSGGAWSGWTTIPGSTVDSPAVAVAGTVLHIAVRGSDGSSIYDGRKDLTGGAWLGWMRLSGSSPSRPALTAVSDTEIYLSVRGSDSRVYVNAWNGASWSSWSQMTGGATSNAPSITAKSGKLYIAVQGTDGGIYWSSRPLPSGTWSNWSKLPGSTPSSPTLA
jgi:hypothetical protein